MNSQEELLLALLDMNKVMRVEEAVIQTGLTMLQIQEFARSHPDLVLYMGGETQVVCQAVQLS